MQKTNTERIHKLFHIFSISHQTYTTNSTLNYHSTLPRTNHIGRYDKIIAHDDYQLTTKPNTTETTRDHEVDAIIETEGDF